MSRQQRILAAGLFVVAWGTNVSTPLILRYQDRLSLSDTGAVGIFTIYVVGILFSLLFAGRLSDRFGRRPVILPFTGLSAIASLTLVLGRNSLALLFLGRLLLGAVSGAVLSVGTAWLSELNEGGSSAAERMRLAGATTAIVYVGFGFGPISSALYERLGPAPLVVPYLFHAAVTFVVLAVMLRLPETKRADSAIRLRPQVGVPAASRGEFLGVLAPAAIWVFGFPSTSFALFPVILRDAVGAGNDVLVAGVTGTLTALSALLSRPILRRVGNARSSLLVGLRIGVVGYVVGTLAFVTDLWQMVPLAAVLMGSASGIILTAGLALTDAIADDTNRGALSASYYFAAYCGMAMPVIITLLARISSIAAALLAITLLAAATALLLSIRMRTQSAVLPGP